MPAGTDREIAWINPIGGLGDSLMLSGVLALAHAADPQARWNLVRRARYTTMFRGHPAIASIGNPPAGARIIEVGYWDREPLGPGRQRPFQILARLFGVPTPAPEELFLAGELAHDAMLEQLLAGKQRVVVVAPASDSPRKSMRLELWKQVHDRLAAAGAFVIQVGREGEPHLGTAYSLVGCTTPRQLAFLVRRVSLVLTADNFVMHVAHMTGTPAVVVWGPTRHEVYGYPGHVHLQTGLDCPEHPRCVGPGLAAHYATPCPRGEELHCVNTVDLEAVVAEAAKMLDGAAGQRG